MFKPLDQPAYERWKESLQNFAWLPKGVPGATDIDFLVHRGTKGKDSFLVLEFKAVGERVGTSQLITLRALSKLPNFTVAVVYGPDRQGLYLVVPTRRNRGNGAKQIPSGVKLTKKELSESVERWWKNV